MPQPQDSESALPRAIADAYVEDLLQLDPIAGTYLGRKEGNDRLPDFSPDGAAEMARLRATTVRRLEQAAARPGGQEASERRCARLLAERLGAEQELYDAGEELRQVRNLDSPVHQVQEAFNLMPGDTEEDWAAVAARMRAVPETLRGYRRSLQEGLSRGLRGGPLQVATVVEQIGEWLGGDGSSATDWFATVVADGPESMRGELEQAAEQAADGCAELRRWLREEYAPAVADAPDTAGEERYARWVRYFLGADLDLHEAYAYGWSEFHRLLGEMRAEGRRILPEAESVEQVLRHLEAHGEAIEGEAAIRDWLQALMDSAIEDLDGTHFDLAPDVRRVETRIAPPGTAAAPYYTQPAADFSRPGRTWLPTLGRTRFPVYELVSTWYHEGVPGHHLQLAQWQLVADRMSQYQTTIGIVSANVEGWALYSERLMDELGYLGNPEHRMGYLSEQMMRAIRVIIDIGMHLELTIPADSGFHPGERWTPALAEEFFRRHSGHGAAFIRSELVRYQGMPGQAIGYKLGERVWLRGREAARGAHGDDFDLKQWHMAALSLGSLGLDDLLTELSAL